MNPSALSKYGRLVHMNCVCTKAFNSQSLSLSSHQWAKAETWSPWTPTAFLIPTSSSSSSRTPKTRPRRRPKPSALTSTPNGTRPLICELKIRFCVVYCPPSCHWLHSTSSPNDWCQQDVGSARTYCISSSCCCYTTHQHAWPCSWFLYSQDKLCDRSIASDSR